MRWALAAVVVLTAESAAAQDDDYGDDEAPVATAPPGAAANEAASSPGTSAAGEFAEAGDTGAAVGAPGEFGQANAVEGAAGAAGEFGAAGGASGGEFGAAGGGSGDEFGGAASVRDPGFAGTGLQLTFAGRIQSDLRFRVEEKSVGGFYDRRTLPVGISRNQNLFGARIDAKYGNVSAKADIDFVLYGYRDDVQNLGDLSRGEAIDPYRFDVHQLYVQAKDLVVDGLDLRIGQQVVLWGVGDQFNPTNNLNADDLEDPLFFGEQQGNFMVKADYWVTSEWSLSAVFVPVFKPAFLPRTGELALARVDRIPVEDEALRLRFHAETALARRQFGFPTVVGSTRVELPDTSIDNVQFGYRLGGSLAEQDVAFTYYLGRHDFPVPKSIVTTQQLGEQCADSLCVNGVLSNEVTLHYPKMHVYGFNMTGEIPWLNMITDAIKPIGYRIEAALVVPERATMSIHTGALDLGVQVPAAEYDYDGDGTPGGALPTVIGTTPFAKWAVGLDYSFGQYVYANAQWVHGLPDEHGAGDWITEGFVVREGGVTTTDGLIGCVIGLNGDACAYEVLKPRLGDYLVTGVDIRFAEQQALLRLFTIFDLSGVDISFWNPETEARQIVHHSMFTTRGFAAVLYPEFSYNFGNGLELGAGALVQLGKTYSKFGDPAAGGSSVFTRGRFSF